MYAHIRTNLVSILLGVAKLTEVLVISFQSLWLGEAMQGLCNTAVGLLGAEWLDNEGNIEEVVLSCTLIATLDRGRDGKEGGMGKEGGREEGIVILSPGESF